MSQQSIDAAPLPESPIAALRPKRTLWQNVGQFIRYKPLGVFGGVIASILFFIAIFAGVLATHDYTFPNSSRILAPPSSEMWLGGDALGRDMYSRLLHGARISLYVGILSSFIGTTTGMLVGIASVHYGGKIDLIVQRIVDAMIAFPGLILAIAIMAASRCIDQQRRDCTQHCLYPKRDQNSAVTGFGHQRDGLYSCSQGLGCG